MTLIILCNQIKNSVGNRFTSSFLPLAVLEPLLTVQVLFLFSLTLCLAVFCFVVQVGLELSILLPQRPQCWDYGLVLPHRAGQLLMRSVPLCENPSSSSPHV